VIVLYVKRQNSFFPEFCALDLEFQVRTVKKYDKSGNQIQNILKLVIQTLIISENESVMVSGIDSFP
jgi:hypothetical protein